MTPIERKFFEKAHPALAAAGVDGAQVEPNGWFTGYASVTGNVDLQGDVVVSGAYLMGDGTEFPLLAHHKQDRPIGLVKAYPMSSGLWVSGRPNMDVQEGRELVALAKQGAVTGMSIGYSVKDSYRKGGVRYLTKIEIAEVSICAFPANPKARILGVKQKELDQLLSLQRDMLSYTRSWLDRSRAA
jgi:HK97 family phage prohead protease